MKTNILKGLFLFLLFVLTINVCEARVHVYLNIGPAYGTTYGPHVVWVPGHWDHGYWVPGQYVEYGGYAPGPGYIWTGGGYHHRHWHHGYWHHHH